LSSDLSSETADAIFRLTSLAHFSDRFVIPPAHREEAIELIEQTATRKENTGFGFIEKPERGL
jgi:nitrate reductase / nitrite oxidoreductase, beta subunit